jgi:hypothetical protein
MWTASMHLLAFLVLYGFQGPFEVEPLVGFALDVVRYYLSLLDHFELLVDSVANVALLGFIDLNGFLDVVDLWARPIDVLSAQMTVIVFLYHWLDQYLWLRFVYLADLH